MFQKFKKQIASIGASSNFEKARIKAAYKGDTSAPTENELEKILHCLSGKDQETPAILGFRILIAKLEIRSSKQLWNPIIKYLIILDRVVEEKLFLQEMSIIQLKSLEIYEDIKNKNLNIDKLVRKYFSLLKAKATLYGQQGSYFKVQKSERQTFFNNLTPKKMSEELEKIHVLQDMIFDIESTGNKGYLKYKCIQYLYLLLFYCLLSLYSMQFTGMIIILDQIFKVDLAITKKWTELYKHFIENTKKLVAFIDTHQFIKGFQVSTHNFYQPNVEVINNLESYIKIKESNEENQEKEGLKLKFEGDWDLFEKNIDLRRISINIDKSNDKRKEKAALHGGKANEKKPVIDRETVKETVEEDVVVPQEQQEEDSDIKEIENEFGDNVEMEYSSNIPCLRISEKFESKLENNKKIESSSDGEEEENQDEFSELVFNNFRLSVSAFEKNELKRLSFRQNMENLNSISEGEKILSSGKTFVLSFDDFNQEIFDKFSSHFSQDYGKSRISFYMTMGTERSHLTFNESTIENAFLTGKAGDADDEDITFVNYSNFNEELFKSYKGIFSSKFKFEKKKGKDKVVKREKMLEF